MGTQPQSFIYRLSTAAFTLQRQSWVVATETIQPSRKTWNIYYPILYRKFGSSLMVQWLGYHALTAADPDSIPGQGTKIPQAVQLSQAGLTQQWFIISPNSVVGWAQPRRFFPSTLSLMRLHSSENLVRARTSRLVYSHVWSLSPVGCGILILFHAASLSGLSSFISPSQLP